MEKLAKNITLENASETYKNKDFSNSIIALEKMYEIVNEHFAGTVGKIELPVFITVQNKGKRSVYGWCSTIPYYQDVDGKNVAYEINIASETLGRPIADTFKTLVHEMVHLINTQHEIKDTSGSSGRHNKKFLATCEKVGLHCYDSGTNAGYCTHSPIEKSSKELQNVLAKCVDTVDVSVLAVNRIETVKGTLRAKKAKKSTNLHKYICPKCGAIARAKADASLICGSCFSETKDLFYMNECVE